MTLNCLLLLVVIKMHYSFGRSTGGISSQYIVIHVWCVIYCDSTPSTAQNNRGNDSSKLVASLNSPFVLVIQVYQTAGNYPENDYNNTCCNFETSAF